jgi:hypothetical protein
MTPLPVTPALDARQRRAAELIDRDMILRLLLAIADPSKSDVPGLSVRDAMGVAG